MEGYRCLWVDQDAGCTLTDPAKMFSMLPEPFPYFKTRSVIFLFYFNPKLLFSWDYLIKIKKLKQWTYFGAFTFPATSNLIVKCLCSRFSTRLMVCVIIMVSTLASLEYPFKICSVSEDSYTRACTNESRWLYWHVFKGKDERLFIRQTIPQPHITDAKRLQISSN